MTDIHSETGSEVEAAPAVDRQMLKFLYELWWRIQFSSLDRLTQSGAAFIVANTSGYIPWPALMLAYALNNVQSKSRQIYTLADLDYIQDEKILSFLHSQNFVPWSYDNAKYLIEKGELIIAFPEDNNFICKTSDSCNRLKRFDWTRFLPAIECKTPILPLVTLGIDESNSTLQSSTFVSNLLATKTFPHSQFLAWFAFSANLGPLPTAWKMKLLPPLNYHLPSEREAIQEEAKRIAFRAEGEIQAEINRLLRSRPKLI